MTESSASTADSFERMMNSLSSIVDRLDSIDSNLQQFASSAKFKSQSSAKDFENSDRPFGQHHANFLLYIFYQKYNLKNLFLMHSGEMQFERGFKDSSKNFQSS